MNAVSNSTLVSTLQLLSRISAVLVTLIGCLGFGGWLFDVAALRSIVPGFESMKFNTAVGFLLAGCSLWLLYSGARQTASKRMARVLAAGVTLIGFFTGIEYLFNVDLGIDQLFFQDIHSVSVSPGRMSVATALNFFLAGLALLFPDTMVRRFRLTILPLFVLASSFVALVAYAYGVETVYQVGSFASMAIHTAAAFFLLSLGILHARPAEGVMNIFSGHGSGSIMIRRVLPVSALVTVSLGWIGLRGVESGLYGPAFGVALFAVTNIFVLSLLLWRNAAMINQGDEEIRAAESRYRITMDHMMEGAQIIGFDWRYLYLNDVAVAQSRKRKDELIGRTMTEAFPGIENTPMFAELRRCMEERLPHRMENEFKYPDGSAGWFTLSMEPVPEGVFILSSDITKEKQQEQELQRHREHLEQLVKERTAALEVANKELESFSYSVSHDLRAPLRHIDGFADLLMRQASDLDEKRQRLLKTISESAKHMGVLIDELLAFSRMARTEMRTQKVDPERLVQEVLATLGKEMEGRTIEWTIDPLSEIHADPMMIRLAFQNLLGNAIKYTRPREKAEIRVGCEAKGNEIIFFVKDNGVGFDMNYVGKLFNVFQRLHRADEFEGTGIGLANVQRIIHRHGGRTWAESTEGSGATFYFSLPNNVQGKEG